MKDSNLRIEQKGTKGGSITTSGTRAKQKCLIQVEEQEAKQIESMDITMTEP